MKILLADDNPIDRLIARNLADKMGWECKLVATGKEALATIQSSNYNFIFLDINMPGKSGMDVIADLQNDRNIKFSELAIYGLTASHSSKFGKFKKAGFAGILSKPLRLQDLQELERVEMTKSNNEFIKRKIFEICDNDLEFQTELIDSFVQQMEEIRDVMHSAITEINLSAAKDIRHKAQSTIKLLGLQELNILITQGIEYLEERSDQLPDHYHANLDLRIQLIINSLS